MVTPLLQNIELFALPLEKREEREGGLDEGGKNALLVARFGELFGSSFAF